MLIAEMKKIEAALAVVKDSETMLINLRFSIRSESSGCDFGISGLVPYLNATKRALRVRMFGIAIRALWLRVGRKTQFGR
ncbi:hypothetical protein PITCH_A2200001 [uncultured Desulfobacterium sp.]|uniref:Uncharacterized protein n=1 Tax=uncultured Desulfobacterium sp. TaxID=201089 RepID=A0A445MXW7_9BACT|nr:hypothetical protein PITCH_A2200001 [uncultured Desulfobacterium sp.]